MAAPNSKEIILITQLRENLQDLDLCEEVTCNANLIRWLRARHLKVDAAEQMFRKYIEWFDKMQLSRIFQRELPEEVTDVFVQPVSGLDHDGNPLTLSPLGQMDLATLLEQGHHENLIWLNIQLLERNAYFVRSLMAQKKKNDSLILISTISDMEGLSMRQFLSPGVIKFISEQSKNIDQYYPETVNRVIVINAPCIFTLFWAVVKPFLSEATASKIEIFGTNRAQWQAALLELAPRESLPMKYGGTLPDDVDILPKPEHCTPKKRGSY